jgi:hypothetical protein
MGGHSSVVGGLGVLLIASTAVAQPPGGFPGGPFEPPQPGQVLPGPIQDRLQLSAAQK